MRNRRTKIAKYGQRPWIYWALTHVDRPGLLQPHRIGRVRGSSLWDQRELPPTLSCLWRLNAPDRIVDLAR